MAPQSGYLCGQAAAQKVWLCSVGFERASNGRDAWDRPSSRKNKRAVNTFGIMLNRKYPLPVRQYAKSSAEDNRGNRLRKARIAKNMTIIDLANAIKISETNLIYIEKNKTTASLPTLRKLAKVLSVEISYLGCFENLPEETLGQRITKTRCYMGLTKKELAEKIGVDVKTITNWEKDLCKPGKKIKSLLRIYKSNCNRFSL